MSKNEPHTSFWHNAYRHGTAGSALEDRPLSGFSAIRVRLDLFCLLEILMVVLAGYAVAEAYVAGVLGNLDFADNYIWPILGLPALLGIVLQRMKLYELSIVTDFLGSFGGITLGVISTFAGAALLAVVLGVTDDYSRVWFGSWFAATLVILWTSRALATRVFSRIVSAGSARKRVVLFGSEKEIEPFLKQFGPENPHFRFVSWFGRKAARNRKDIKRELENLVRLWPVANFEMVIVAPSYGKPDQLEFILNEIGMLSVEIRVIPPTALSSLSLLGVSSQGQQQFIDVQRSRSSDWGWLLKRVEDYAIAGLAVVLLSWLLALIALAIRIESRGPALYVQKRTGLNNRVFNIYKFRSMADDDGSGKLRQTERVDKRVTRVGKFLRRTSLDELPQLFNVLKGEMSIVGPRPHPTELNEAYAPHVHLFNKRHSVKPGITGWAQIHDHRGPISTKMGMQQRLKFDLDYVDNWSIWFDLKIILATPFLSLIHRNAY